MDTAKRLSRRILPRLVFAGALVTMAIGVGGAAHADEPSGDTYVRIVIDTETPSYVCPDKR